MGVAFGSAPLKNNLNSFQNPGQASQLGRREGEARANAWGFRPRKRVFFFFFTTPPKIWYSTVHVMKRHCSISVWWLAPRWAGIRNQG